MIYPPSMILALSIFESRSVCRGCRCIDMHWLWTAPESHRNVPQSAGKPKDMGSWHLSCLDWPTHTSTHVHGVCHDTWISMIYIYIYTCIHRLLLCVYMYIQYILLLFCAYMLCCSSGLGLFVQSIWYLFDLIVLFPSNVLGIKVDTNRIFSALWWSNRVENHLLESRWCAREKWSSGTMRPAVGLGWIQKRHIGKLIGSIRIHKIPVTSNYHPWFSGIWR